MANLTLSIDSDVLKKARMRAVSEDTSINAVVRDYLESYAGMQEGHLRAVETILQLARTSDAGSEGRRWTRDDIYEERLERGERLGR